MCASSQRSRRLRRPLSLRSCAHGSRRWLDSNSALTASASREARRASRTARAAARRRAQEAARAPAPSGAAATSASSRAQVASFASAAPHSLQPLRLLRLPRLPAQVHVQVPVRGCCVTDYLALFDCARCTATSVAWLRARSRAAASGAPSTARGSPPPTASASTTRASTRASTCSGCCVTDFLALLDCAGGARHLRRRPACALASGGVGGSLGLCDGAWLATHVPTSRRHDRR